MKIRKVIRVFTLLLILSLLAFVLFGDDLLFLIKALALTLAITIGYLLYLNKSSEIVKKGDEIVAVGLKYLMGKKGIALTPAKKNEKIRVKFYDGKEAEGIVERTEGLFTPALVRIIYEEEVIK